MEEKVESKIKEILVEPDTIHTNTIFKIKVKVKFIESYNLITEDNSNLLTESEDNFITEGDYYE